MEITKMLTVSTSHISEETAMLLTKICDGFEHELIVFPKKYLHDYYGWFIYCNVCKPDLDIPDDLMRLMCFTSDSGIDWLCLDQDGEIIENEFLKTYEW